MVVPTEPGRHPYPSPTGSGPDSTRKERVRSFWHDTTNTVHHILSHSDRRGSCSSRHSCVTTGYVTRTSSSNTVSCSTCSVSVECHHVRNSSSRSSTSECSSSNQCWGSETGNTGRVRPYPCCTTLDRRSTPGRPVPVNLLWTGEFRNSKRTLFIGHKCHTSTWLVTLARRRGKPPTKLEVQCLLTVLMWVLIY